MRGPKVTWPRRRGPESEGAVQPDDGDSNPGRRADIAARVLAGLGAFALAMAIAATAVSATAPTTCSWCHSVDRGHANVSCWRCHDGGAFLAPALRPVRVAGMFASRGAPAGPASSAIDDRACLGCHGEMLRGIVVVGGIRVRHAGFVPQEPCGSCHGEHRPALGRPTLDRCARCHNEDGQDSECTTCHEGPVPALADAGGWLGLAHTGSVEGGHGPGGAAACALCHESEECRACHGVRLPHGPLDTWRTLHGRDAVDGSDACRPCHERRECDGCHRLEMPHSADFLDRHSDEVSDRGEKLCLTCHVDEDCVRCHRWHVHPYGPFTKPKAER